MRKSSFRSGRRRTAASGFITVGRRLAPGAGCILAALGAAALGNSCAVDERTFRGAGNAGAGGASGDSAQGGAGATTPGASGASPEAGSGGSSTSSIGGSDALAGAGGNAAGQGGSAAADAGMNVDPDPVLPLCASQLVAGLGSATATTAATGAGQFALGCGPGSADDVGIFWVAPEAGYYSIDTFGSAFDTVLGVMSSDCTAELACNDDAGAEITSEIVREFAAGEAVVFAVDGKSGSFGDVVLNTHAITCPALDLNRQSPPVVTTTLDGTNEHLGRCGGDGQLEKAFRWKAPSAGLFRFTASSDGFSCAVYVERGARCGGELIACNVGGSASPATVVARLAADEVVTVIVDGIDGSGDVELNVDDISGDLCPNQPGFNPFDEVSGVLTGGNPSVLTGSCVPARQVMLPGGAFDLPEHSYPITIDGAICRVGITADAPVAVYVQEGQQCGGRELYCEPLDDASEGALIEHTLGEIGGDALDYVVTVEATDPNGPSVNYTLGFLCALP